MKRYIYKYTLDRLVEMGEQAVATHKDAEVVLVGHQDHVPTVWLEVILDKPEEMRVFRIYGTGMRIPYGDQAWVGSYIDDPFVWHIYESVP